MTRIRFEDLPSRNTPRNAENLNKLNNVAISPTEPTTGEEVWIKKSDNLFNVNTPVSTYVINGEGNFVESADKFLYINQKIKASGNITVSWKSVNTTPTIRIAEYTAGGTFISRPYVLPYEQTSPVTINLDSNTDYIIVSVEHNDTDKVIDLQIEQGETATEYEPYVDKEIYAKNDNGVYELFNKVEEPQYCQVTRSSSITLNIPNIQYEKTKMPFDKIDKQQGDFSLADGGIKIGKNINRIKLTANIMVNTITQEGMFTLIARTNNEQSKAFSYFRLKAYEPITFTYIIDVKENDIVDIAFQNQEFTANTITIYGAGNYVATSMLIEKIA